MNTTADDDALILQEARGLIDSLSSSLPERIQAAALTLKSKLPFKALSIRELLLHRVSALASAAVELFEEKRVIPAIVLTRSVVETVAVMFALHERLARFLENKNSDELDEFLMRSLVGARNNPDLPDAINVLTLIDRVEKTIPDFRFVYDILCECTHPNWAGTFGAFGQVNREKFELELGPSSRTPAFSTGISALSGALMTFHHYYNDSADLIYQLNEHLEQHGSH